MGIIEKIKFGEMDEEELLELVTSNNMNIALAVAESVYSTAPILDIAAHDNDERVRFAAVNNPNIEKGTLEYLLDDPVGEIAEAAMKRLERN